jgi:hypothetical protein
MVMTLLRAGVFVSLVISLAVLAFQVFQARKFGRSRLHSEAQGSQGKGIAYAFGRGMMPWEKESAAGHLPTYIAGMIYHAGIFTAILYALGLAASIRLPRAVLAAMPFLLAAGFLSGTGLLLKRVADPKMRYLSCPDDYVANLLVDAFILAGLLTFWRAVPPPVFLAAAILTFSAMPLGKIRHCFFFFYSRVLFGSYFGRRGVLPRRTPAKTEVRS